MRRRSSNVRQDYLSQTISGFGRPVSWFRLHSDSRDNRAIGRMMQDPYQAVINTADARRGRESYVRKKSGGARGSHVGPGQPSHGPAAYPHGDAGADVDRNFARECTGFRRRRSRTLRLVDEVRFRHPGCCSRSPRHPGRNDSRLRPDLPTPHWAPSGCPGITRWPSQAHRRLLRRLGRGGRDHWPRACPHAAFSGSAPNASRGRSRMNS
jgi:hypothetical protein